MQKQLSETVAHVVAVQSQSVALLKVLSLRVKNADALTFQLLELVANGHHAELSKFLKDFGPESQSMKQRNKAFDAAFAKLESAGEKLEAITTILQDLGGGQ